MRTDKSKIVADIGGTNARFAFVDGEGGLSSIRVLKCSDYEGPVDSIRAYLAEFDGSSQLQSASFSIAAPLDGDRVEMTNGPWVFSIEDVQKSLKLNSLTVINDFVAKALSIPALNSGDVLKIGVGEAVGHQPIAILGPGTGLGVSSLIPGANGWTPMGGEGGHVSWSAQDDREIDILRRLRKKFGHVSAERLVSGPGIENILSALEELDCVTPSHRTAPEITKAAIEESEPICVDCLNTFCSALGNVAGNLALSIGAKGGVYIGGGIVRNFLDFMPNSPFRGQFENKGRFSEYLKAIPTYFITVPHTGLMGAAEAMKRS